MGDSDTCRRGTPFYCAGAQREGSIRKDKYAFPIIYNGTWFQANRLLGKDYEDNTQTIILERVSTELQISIDIGLTINR